MRNHLLILLSAFLFTTCSPSYVFAASGDENPAADVDELQRRLDSLDQRIEQHVQRARETMFWDEENTEAPPQLTNDTEPVAEQPVAQTLDTPEIRKVRAAPKAPVAAFDQDIDAIQKDLDAMDEQLRSRTRVSGRYRMAFGAGRHRTFSVNDSSADLQDTDWHHLFGERRENTFDPAIYSKYQVDIDVETSENSSFYTQIVADPWSYTGVSSETRVFNNDGTDSYLVQQKYFGANNSVIPQTVHSSKSNYIGIPEMEIHDGKSQSFTATGFTDWGTTYDAPRMDLDFEFRPIRKMWTDLEGDIWHARVFPLADQNQIMITDDPLGLSNTKDYWENSAWLDTWKPVEQFTDLDNAFGFKERESGSILRGRYEDDEAFHAKDSEGNYLTLLRGAAIEADFGRTYLGGMIASKYGPWDEYQEFNNVPGVVRLKHYVTPEWMVGGLYGFRIGMIDREPDAYNNIISVDTKYHTNPTDYMYGQIAGSRNDNDRLGNFSSSYEGMAYRAGFVMHDGNASSAITKTQLDFGWMDTRFKSTITSYDSLRNDEFWGKYLTFAEIPYDLRPFKIGTGFGRGRYVSRLNINTEAPHHGIDHLFDIRHVRSTDDNSFIENVIRSEMDYKITPKLKFKTLMRWHTLPKTLSDVEPFLDGVISINQTDPALFDAKLENIGRRTGSE